MEIVQLKVEVPSDLRTSIKVLAAQKQTTVTALVQRYLLHGMELDKESSEATQSQGNQAA